MLLLRFANPKGPLLIPGHVYSQLRNLPSPLIPQEGIANAHPNQILHALEVNTVATVQAAGSTFDMVPEEYRTALAKLVDGNSYELATLADTLTALTEYIYAGTYSIPPAVTGRNFYTGEVPFIVNDMRYVSSWALRTLQSSARLFAGDDSLLSAEEVTVHLAGVTHRLLHEADESQLRQLNQLDTQQETALRTFAKLSHILHSDQVFQLKLSFVLQAVGALNVWHGLCTGAQSKHETSAMVVSEGESNLLKPFKSLDMSRSLRLCIERNGLTHVYQVARLSAKEFQTKEGIGTTHANEMRVLLYTLGLSFDSRIEPERLQALQRRTGRPPMNLEAALLTPWHTVKLSARTKKALHQHGFTRAYQVAQMAKSELLRFEGIGMKQQAEIERVLHSLGLEFGMLLEPYQVLSLNRLAGVPRRDPDAALLTPLESIKLAPRLRSILVREGMTHLYQVALRSASEFMALEDVGFKQCHDMKAILDRFGLHFGYWLSPRRLAQLELKTAQA